jgi:N-acetylglutamate synthase-like GNAT family acetyltransferase
MDIFNAKPIFNSPDILEVYALCMYMPTDEKLQSRAQEIMNSDHFFAFGCRINNVVAGVAAFSKDSDEVAVLRGIATAPEYRKSGIGRALILYAMETLGLAALYAETDDDAIGFYRSCDFEIEDLGFKYENYRRYRCTLRRRVR